MPQQILLQLKFMLAGGLHGRIECCCPPDYERRFLNNSMCLSAWHVPGEYIEELLKKVLNALQAMHCVGSRAIQSWREHQNIMCPWNVLHIDILVLRKAWFVPLFGWSTVYVNWPCSFQGTWGRDSPAYLSLCSCLTLQKQPEFASQANWQGKRRAGLSI